jgi:folate-binding protein YgfZ
MSLSWYLQPAPIVFKVTGKDARRYLNNRLSQDLRTIEPGLALIAGALTPQGRVEGLFTVYVEPNDTFYLACDGGERQPLFAALGRYIVADRVSIVDCSEESLVGHVVGSAPTIPPSQGICLTTPRTRIGAEGRDFLIVSPAIPEVRKALLSQLGSPLTKEAYDIARFKCGAVQYPSEVNENLLLTEAGLRKAVSFQKGCYVGQEVMERSDAIGKLPRRVERIVFQGAIPLPVNAQVLNAEAKPIGKIISAFPSSQDSCTYAFALLKSGAYAVQDRVRSEGLEGDILSTEGEAEL